jgi:hypothetical protein
VVAAGEQVLAETIFLALAIIRTDLFRIAVNISIVASAKMVFL